jgi:hypothetical protein
MAPIPPQKKDKIEIVSAPQDQNSGSDIPHNIDFKIEDYIAILKALKVVKKPIDYFPTTTPKTFLDAIQIYEVGGTHRLYIFVNATWRYVALT